MDKRYEPSRQHRKTLCNNAEYKYSKPQETQNCTSEGRSIIVLYADTYKQMQNNKGHKEHRDKKSD